MTARGGLWKDTVIMAARALGAHVLRSALTVSGVVIGITAVVGMSAMIRGLDEAIMGDVRAMNPDVVYLNRIGGIVMSRQEWLKLMRRPLVTLDDLRAIEEGCRSVGRIEVMARRGPVALAFGRRRTRDLNVVGTGPAYLDVNGMTVVAGRFFAPGEAIAGARVVVLGQGPVESLFGPVDPLDKTVRLEGQEYRVVGVFPPRRDPDSDNFCAIPYEAYRRDILQGARQSLNLAMVPRAGVSVERMMDDVTEVMRARRRLRASDENDFGFLTQASILAFWRRLSGTLFLGLIGISSIALFVSGIGVLAVMTVSVAERTREIGVRRAIGARRRDILAQFLAEAAILTATGGALGSALGAGIGLALGRLLALNVSAPWQTFAVAIGVSGVVGLVFGVVPAWRAARLDPVEALRYE